MKTEKEIRRELEKSQDALVPQNLRLEKAKGYIEALK